MCPVWGFKCWVLGFTFYVLGLFMLSVLVVTFSDVGLSLMCYVLGVGFGVLGFRF